MSDQPRCVSNWPPAYDNLSYSITVPRISLNFNDPSYGMLRVLRCMHFIHLLLSFSLLRARGLSTFARRFTASARTIDPSIDQFFFLSIAHSLPFLFFLSFFLSLSTLLFLLRWIILLNVRRFFSTLRSIHHLVSRDLKLSSLRVSFRNSFFLIRTISSPSLKITSL